MQVQLIKRQNDKLLMNINLIAICVKQMKCITSIL